MTSFNLYHKSGLLIPFAVSPDADALKHVQNVLSAVEWALANGLSVTEPEKTMGASKTYTITGWVYGRSAKQGVPVVWLYSDVSPEHKVAHVYSEKIDALPLGMDIKQSGLKPFPGGLAPKKSIAKEDGWFNACDPFVVSLEDTGETFEGHPVYKFVKVVSAVAEQPAQSIKATATAPQSPQPTTTTTEESDATGTTEEVTGEALFNSGKAALEQQIKTLFPDNVLEATMWLLKRWTVKNTPGNVRVKIGYLTDNECSAIADQCAQYAEGIVKAFKDFLVAGNAAKLNQQPTGK